MTTTQRIEGPGFAHAVTVEVRSRDQRFVDEFGGGATDSSVWNEVWKGNAYHLDPERHLRGGTVIDCGANVGAFALLVLASHPTESVVAIEPEPENLALLKKNLAINGDDIRERVMIVDAALGDGQPVELVGQGACTSTRELGIQGRRDDRGNVVEVRYDEVERMAHTVTLAGVLRNHDEIDFLKLDIEGAEYPVLCTLPQDQLQKVRYIAGEFHPTRGMLRYTGPGDLVNAMLRTHSVSLFGQPESGGMFYAHRYDL